MRLELERTTPHNRKASLFRCLPILRECPAEAFDLPTNPLKIALEFVDPSAISGPPGGISDGSGATPLHWVAEMSDPYDPLVNENQVRMGKILLDAGANVNAQAEHLCDNVIPLQNFSWITELIQMPWI